MPNSSGGKKAHFSYPILAAVVRRKYRKMEQQKLSKDTIIVFTTWNKKPFLYYTAKIVQLRITYGICIPTYLLYSESNCKLLGIARMAWRFFFPPFSLCNFFRRLNEGCSRAGVVLNYVFVLYLSISLDKSNFTSCTLFFARKKELEFFFLGQQFHLDLLNKSSVKSRTSFRSHCLDVLVCKNNVLLLLFAMIKWWCF